MSITTILLVNSNTGVIPFLESLLNQSMSVDELIVYNNNRNENEIQQVLRDSKMELNFYSKIETCLKKAKGDIILFADEKVTWAYHRVEDCVTQFQQSESLLLISDLLVNNQSVLNSLGYKVKQKLLLAEGKADQVFASINNLPCALLTIGKQALKEQVIPLTSEIEGGNDLAKWLLAIIAAQYPDRVAFLDKANGNYESMDNLAQGLNSEYSNSKELQFLDSVLKRVENNSFRRAHYFWYMRSLLASKSFGAKFISINTLFLEGDYKRFTDKAIPNALSDLFN